MYRMSKSSSVAPEKCANSILSERLSIIHSDAHSLVGCYIACLVLKRLTTNDSYTECQAGNRV